MALSREIVHGGIVLHDLQETMAIGDYKEFADPLHQGAASAASINAMEEPPEILHLHVIGL